MPRKRPIAAIFRTALFNPTERFIQEQAASLTRWRPVLVTRSDHGGRFRARYRFRYVDGSASIRLRATALAEERWPYAPGSSPAVTVRVSGL